MQYQLIANTDYIKRFNADGTISSIPSDPTNTDWQAYQAWLGEGNTPDPAE